MPITAPTRRRPSLVAGSASAPGPPMTAAPLLTAAPSPLLETSPTASMASPPQPRDLFHAGLASSPGAAESTSTSVAARELIGEPLRLAGSAWDEITEETPAAAASRERDAATLLFLNEPEETSGWDLIRCALLLFVASLLAPLLFLWHLAQRYRANKGSCKKTCVYTCA